MLNKAGKRRVGLMGGTFDPIHNGHIRLAQAAYEECGLDEVVFLPSGEPPHKQGKKISPAKDRCAMVKLAIAGQDYFSFSDIELKREGRTYTADTLRYLKVRYPENVFYFLMGADSLLYFEHWREPETIIGLSALVVAVRDRDDLVVLQKKRQELLQKFGGEIVLLSMEKIDVSSTLLRQQLAEGHYDKTLLPESVGEYALAHHLYDV